MKVHLIKLIPSEGYKTDLFNPHLFSLPAPFLPIKIGIADPKAIDWWRSLA
jgi:hypothetical protein